MNPRWIIRSRRWLLLVAALPLLQLGPCHTVIGQTTYIVGQELPSIAFNSLGTAITQTLLSILGLGSNALFGGANLINATGAS